MVFDLVATQRMPSTATGTRILTPTQRDEWRDEINRRREALQRDLIERLEQVTREGLPARNEWVLDSLTGVITREVEEVNYDIKAEYNEKEKRYEVQLPFERERSKRFFKTKRSAQRFIKRFEAKIAGEPKKKPASIRKVREYYKQQDEDYLERLGV